MAENLRGPKRVTICIDEHACALTDKELYAIAAILSESHGELCQLIGSCCDMAVATDLASHLEPLNDACARVMDAAAKAREEEERAAGGFKA